MKIFFFFGEHLRFVSLVLGLEHSCPWPRECLSSERLSLASDFFCVLGLEPCVLDSTSDYWVEFSPIFLICITSKLKTLIYQDLPTYFSTITAVCFLQKLPKNLDKTFYNSGITSSPNFGKILFNGVASLPFSPLLYFAPSAISLLPSTLSAGGIGLLVKDLLYQTS